MRDWFVGLFKDDIGSIRMHAFDGWHFLYIFVILGVAITLAFVLKNKSEETKHKVVNGFLVAAISLYVLDFFCMPFSQGKIDMDKLPFHICTSMSIIACFAQFNKKFTWLKTPAVALCMVASLMYLTYPGTALDNAFPFCYTNLQTMSYHGCLFIYAFLALATKEVTFKWKNIWKELVLILTIACWASFGNYFYKDVQGSDWFFLQNGAFLADIGVPHWLIPFAVISAVFGMVALIYGIYYLVRLIINKINLKHGLALETNVGTEVAIDNEVDEDKQESKDEVANEEKEEKTEKKESKKATKK